MDLQLIQNPVFLLGISGLFAAVPVGVWIYLFFRKAEESRTTVGLIFILGCFTAPILLGIQYLWDKFPKFDVTVLIQDNIQTQSTMYIVLFVTLGAMEEIIKHFVVSRVDKKTLLIKTVDDSIRYSITAALGFSFIENIYYLYQFGAQISMGELIGMYIFRSIFTSCAHIIFSGVFGYYYGMGKFSIDIGKQEEWTGEQSIFVKFLSKTFKLPQSEASKQRMILKGLLAAVIMHATYNYLLQYNVIFPALIFVLLGYLYLRFLLSRKAGNLILITDISTKRKSTIASKDEDVVLELMGMWFKEKKYVDVIHICERMLQRDPDNNVIKIFKAKAMDKMSEDSIYKKILKTIIRSKEDVSEVDKNIISKHLQQKEELKKEQNVEEFPKNK